MTARILILDDDDELRQLVATALGESGLITLHARRADEAERMLQRGSVDLLLVDGLLPDRDGISFIRDLRARGDCTAVVFISAFWKDVATFRMLTTELDVTRVINKPFMVNELLAQVLPLLSEEAPDGARTERPVTGESTASTGRPVAGESTASTESPASTGPDDGTPSEAIVVAQTLIPSPPPRAVESKDNKEGKPLTSQSRSAAGNDRAGAPSVGKTTPAKPRPATAQSAQQSPSDLEQKLEAIRQSYKHGLIDRLEELRQLIMQAREGKTPALEAAHMLAHKIHGTSGAYGLSAISHLAANIEKMLEEIINGQVSSLESLWPPIYDTLSRAQRQCSGAQRQEIADGHLAASSILIVDDDEEFGAQARRVGKNYLFHVVAANTAEEAAQRVASTAFDGALINPTLGDGGIGPLVRQLRSSSRSPLPMAFVSAQAGLDQRSAAVQAGASLFLQKPIADTALMAVMRDLAAAGRTQRPTVLIVDDDQDFIDRLKLVLRSEGIHPESVNEAQAVLDALQEHKPELVLLDALMPRVSGFEICKLLRTSVEWRELPIVFLTGKTQTSVRLACFESGGDDYIDKSASKEELMARIRVRIDRARLHRERSTRDPTTTLLNRQALAEAMQARMSTALRQKRSLAFCFLDLDRFKRVNDTFGHLCGDRVLSRLGRLISLRFRADDVCARWGGEEFVITIFNSDCKTAEAVIHRLLDEFSAIEFEGDHGERFSITFSAGIAEYPAEGNSLEELVKVSDRRLYAAKDAGRSRIHIAD